MNTQDQELSDLLKRWPAIEPPPNFTADVWRRIRLSQEQPAVDDARVAHWLRRWLWQPAFSVAAAMVIGAVVGTWGGMCSVPPQSTMAQQEVGFLAPGTLAGSYLRLWRGSPRSRLRVVPWRRRQHRAGLCWIRLVRRPQQHGTRTPRPMAILMVNGDNLARAYAVA